jgi:hypothetical protein
MADSPYKEALDIYKMEYERAAQRYNDLYNSAWTNFSYMALISGGLLTFGGARFVAAVIVFLACLPLLFWWAASFEPLNRYGDKVQDELKNIEEALRELLISIGLPQHIENRPAHFSNFAKRGQGNTIDKTWRVRYIVRAMAVGLILVTIWSGVAAACLWMKGQPLTIKGEPLTVVVASPTPSPTPDPRSMSPKSATPLVESTPSSSPTE